MAKDLIPNSQYDVRKTAEKTGISPQKAESEAETAEKSRFSLQKTEGKQQTAAKEVFPLQNAGREPDADTISGRTGPAGT